MGKERNGARRGLARVSNRDFRQLGGCGDVYTAACSWPVEPPTSRRRLCPSGEAAGAGCAPTRAGYAGIASRGAPDCRPRRRCVSGSLST